MSPSVFVEIWQPFEDKCEVQFAVVEMEENLTLFSVFHLSLYCLHRFDINSWWNWKFFKLQPLVKVAGLYLFSFRFDGLSSHLLYLSSLLYLSTISDLFFLSHHKSERLWTHLLAISWPCLITQWKQPKNYKLRDLNVGQLLILPMKEKSLSYLFCKKI